MHAWYIRLRTSAPCTAGLDCEQGVTAQQATTQAGVQPNPAASVARLAINTSRQCYSRRLQPGRYILLRASVTYWKGMRTLRVAAAVHDDQGREERGELVTTGEVPRQAIHAEPVPRHRVKG